MASPTLRFRTATKLITGAVGAGLVFAIVSFLSAPSHPFVSALALTLAGVAFGLAVIPLVYDSFQRERRSKLWRQVRSKVTRTLAGRLYLLTIEIRWRFDNSLYTSRGSDVAEADVDPTPQAVAAHAARIAEILATIARFDNNYSIQLVLHEESGELINGDHLVNVLRYLITDEFRRDLRSELASLGPVAEDASDLLIAVEELLATGFWMLEYGKAAAAGELGEERFFHYLDAFLLQLKALYARTGALFCAA